MSAADSRQKRVIFLMIDSLMDASVQAALKSGKVPALQFFMEKGYYKPEVVCPFPSMSVNIDCTLMTGVNCDKHGVPGLVWYNQKENRIVNYGSSKKEMFKLGIGQSVSDMVYNLNHAHLKRDCSTIYESLNKKGKRTTSINGLLYRGNAKHTLKTPSVLSAFTNMDKQLTAHTPDTFSYGIFAKQTPLSKRLLALKKYGFNDKFSVNEWIHRSSNEERPDFTFVYFPNFDQRVHKNGITDVKGLEKADKQLRRMLDTFDSWEAALREYTWVIMGDHGQTDMKTGKEEAVIALPELLGIYRIAELKKGVTSEDDIVLAVNQRMAYIYSLRPEITPLTLIANTLQKDDRIDVIAFREGGRITVMSGTVPGEMHFSADGEFSDMYGQSWHIEGDAGLLDIEKKGKALVYGDYPDPLARLYTALHSHDGDYIVVCAKPGCEFKGESSSTNAGGASHGSLHKQDSHVSLIVSGTGSAGPEHLRTVDVKAWMETLV